jgi:hypothetical protein
MATVRQWKTADADPPSVTLDSMPVQGKPLFAYVSERSGMTTAPTISGTGWTLLFRENHNSGDTSSRRSVALFFKIAGANEPTTISTGWPAPHQLTVFELTGTDSDIQSYLAYKMAHAGGIGNPQISIATGLTTSQNAPMLKLGLFMARNEISGAVPSSVTWTNDSLTSEIVIGGGFPRISHGVALATDQSSGTKGTTATSNTSNNTGISAAIVLFSLPAAPPQPAAGGSIGSGTIGSGTIGGPAPDTGETVEAVVNTAASDQSVLASARHVDAVNNSAISTQTAGQATTAVLGNSATSPQSILQSSTNILVNSASSPQTIVANAAESPLNSAASPQTLIIATMESVTNVATSLQTIVEVVITVPLVNVATSPQVLVAQIAEARVNVRGPPQHTIIETIALPAVTETILAPGYLDVYEEVLAV